MSDKRNSQFHIRPVALAVIRDGPRLLVRRYTAPDGDHYYRPLGGRIEFGERAEQAVNREIMEEIEAEIDRVQHLTTIENIFERDGERAHQIEFLFEARLVDRSLYATEHIHGMESSGNPIEAVWIDLTQPLDGPLYPVCLRDLLLTG